MERMPFLARKASMNRLITSLKAPSSDVSSTAFPPFPPPSRFNQLSYDNVDSFRTTFGDPAFTSNVTTLEKDSITYETALEARARISPNQTFAPTYYDPQLLTATREAGTSHMAIVDKDGMSVSLTTTVNLYFGAQISMLNELQRRESKTDLPTRSDGDWHCTQ